MKRTSSTMMGLKRAVRPRGTLDAGFWLGVLLLVLGCSFEDDRATEAWTCADRGCPGDATCCDGECVDTDIDVDNCGQCAVRCGDGEFCSSGQCRERCGSDAAGVWCDDRCVDTQNDPANCGDCGRGCAEMELCIAGSCEAPATVTETVCGAGNERCGRECVSLGYDRQHCGGCEQPCQASEYCVEGACLPLPEGGPPPCGEVAEWCGDSCSNLSYDPDNCGKCGERCPASSYCADKQCVYPPEAAAPCGPGITLCEPSVCADLEHDPANCGECGRSCAPGEYCDQGGCAEPTSPTSLEEGGADANEAGPNSGLICGSNTTECQGDCINFANDPANCGGCEEPCADGDYCEDGTCRTTTDGEALCGRGSTQCGDRCVDLLNDPANCGECSAECSGIEVCLEGACEDRCGSNGLWCVNECADISTSTEHCGDCQQPCGDGESCVDGECESAFPSECLEGFDFALNATNGYSAIGQPQPSCTISEGSGFMEFQLQTCEWAACDLAIGQDLTMFDLGHDRAGVLEIEYCSESELQGELSLWYGVAPNRKKLLLLGTGERMAPGCRIVRRAPEQAACHWEVPGLEGDCGTPCLNCGRACDAACALPLDSARLTLTAENCADPITTPTSLELRRVTFVPRGCTCADDADCDSASTRPSCVKDDVLLSPSTCPPGATTCGVCAAIGACPNQDEACSVTLGTAICAGKVSCSRGSTYCEFQDSDCVSQ